MEQLIAPVELIIYACPTGELARQVETFYAASRGRFGPNSAHAYPPHITLTGFFHDDALTAPRYAAALGAAYEAAMGRRPAQPVAITDFAHTATFHGLLIASPWLEALTADFATRVVSPTRHDVLRLKGDLHLSLAYGFRPADGPALGELARAMVNPAAPTAWELRLYERRPEGRWHTYAAWPI